ncbi:GntR family transcriptional regulator [Vagococcus salmoninarum]|uniref:GntR family transcriptional regulator n=1 Tax=Vagococcus salmoninarum TaxID=2739 RepID=UPI003F95D28C
MLDNNSAYPLYAQIADQLRLNIRSEKWKEGAKIPTEMELCDYYHVSRITVRKAITELVNENLLYRKRSKGTFVQSPEIINNSFKTVIKGFTQEMHELRRHPVTISAQISVSHADHQIAKILSIKPGDKIIILERVRGVDNDILGFFKTYIKYEDRISLESENYYESFYAYLKTLKITISQEQEYIEAIQAPLQIQQVLKVPPNTPILKRVRFTSDRDSSFLEYTECFYIGSKYRYYLDFKYD